MITTPLAGPGRHPEGRTLAFDGRGKTSVMSKNLGGRDSEAKHNNLFWVVPLYETKADTNLRLETVTMNLVAAFKLPQCAKRRKVEYKDKVMLQVPMMVNPNAIKAHVPLMCLDDATFMSIKQSSPTKS